MPGHLLKFCLQHEAKQEWSLQSQDGCRPWQACFLTRCSISCNWYTWCKNSHQQHNIDFTKRCKLCSTIQIYKYKHIHHQYIPAELYVKYNLTPYYFNSEGCGGMYYLISSHIGLWATARTLGKIQHVPSNTHMDGVPHHLSHHVQLSWFLCIKCFSKEDTNHCFQLCKTNTPSQLTCLAILRPTTTLPITTSRPELS